MIDDRTTDPFLPIANVANVMKECVPPHVKLTREAKELVQESITELICFVITEAQNYAINHRRKTINGTDIITALHNLGFSRFYTILQQYIGSLPDKQ